MCEDRPFVGVGVLIRKDGKILMGKRKNSHGHGTWCPPGGHLEMNESPEECVKRETLEEAGLKIKNIMFIAMTNDVMPQYAKHHITLHFVADLDSGELKIIEPEKCEEWGWFSWDSLPSPLFISTDNLTKQNINPFDI